MSWCHPDGQRPGALRVRGVDQARAAPAVVGAEVASISLLSCETDVRVGGRYQLVFGYDGSTMEFFGRYLEVTPHSCLVWTNDEGDDAGTVSDLRGNGR